MKVEKIQEAVSEAHRFLSRANMAVEKAKASKYGLSDCHVSAGFVRRSSLDLTRSLEEMRKS